MLYDSSGENVFEGNSFVGNLTPLLVAARTDTRFDGNYWSGPREPDLDGDGDRRSALPACRTSSITCAATSRRPICSRRAPAAALGAAERAFPVLRPVPVVDDRPLAHPPPGPAACLATGRRAPRSRGHRAGAAFSSSGARVRWRRRRAMGRAMIRR